MYKCKCCNKQFAGGARLDSVELWRSYIGDRRTLSQLAEQHGCSERTIRRRPASVFDRFVPSFPMSAVVIMDTTYWGHSFGLMLFQDAHTGKVLQRKYLKNETNAHYLEGLNYLRSNGTRVAAIVCDGHTGLLKSITECPVQMCQFHFFQIIRRKLTNNPRLKCGKELFDLCKGIFPYETQGVRKGV